MAGHVGRRKSQTVSLAGRTSPPAPVSAGPLTCLHGRMLAWSVAASELNELSAVGHKPWVFIARQSPPSWRPPIFPLPLCSRSPSLETLRGHGSATGSPRQQSCEQGVFETPCDGVSSPRHRGEDQ